MSWSFNWRSRNTAALYSNIYDEIAKHMENTLNNIDNTCNVTFIVDGKEYPCIWQLFALQSPYFEDLIQKRLIKKNDAMDDDNKNDDIKDNDDVMQIELNILNNEAFLVIQTFVYGLDPKINVNNVANVCYESDKLNFNIPTLYNICIQYIYDIFRGETVTNGMKSWCQFILSVSEIDNDWCLDKINEFTKGFNKNHFTIYHQYMLLNVDEFYKYSKQLFEDLLFNHDIFTDVDPEYLWDSVIKWCKTNKYKDIRYFTKYFDFTKFNIHYINQKIVSKQLIEPEKMVTILSSLITGIKQSQNAGVYQGQTEQGLLRKLNKNIYVYDFWQAKLCKIIKSGLKNDHDCCRAYIQVNGINDNSIKDKIIEETEWYDEVKFDINEASNLVENNTTYVDCIKEYYIASLNNNITHLGNKNIIIGEKKYNIIGELFAIHSIYFKKMFYGNALERRNHIDIPLNDIEPNVFEWFIQYFYGLKPDLNDDIVAGVYIASDKWMLNSIKELCYTYMEEINSYHDNKDVYMDVLMKLVLDGYKSDAKKIIHTPGGNSRSII